MFQLMWAVRLSPFYRLNFQSSKDGMKFVLEIKADSAEIVLERLSNILVRITTVSGMPAFIPPSQGLAGWGYGTIVVETKSKDPAWRAFEIVLPRGIREPLKYVSMYAITEAERTTASDTTVMATKCISGTLAWIFDMLDFDCKTTESEDSSSSQGFFIQSLGHAGMATNRGQCGFTVLLDPPATEWLRSLSQDDRIKLEQKAIRAIVASYSHLMGYRVTTDHSHWSCGISTEGGRIQMRTRGDCACLGVDGGWDPETDSIQVLTSHNIDDAIQQLSLLAGIAVIWKAFTQRLQVK